MKPLPAQARLNQNPQQVPNQTTLKPSDSPMKPLFWIGIETYLYGDRYLPIFTYPCK